MDYFISDTHFGHSNILKFERTKFSSIEDHDFYILSLLKNRLKSNDILYHLGDFGNLTGSIMEQWKGLPCYKILIVGNHDKQKGKLKEIFDEVHNEPLFYQKRVLLSHEPLPVTKESLNIHGHLHGAELKNKVNYKNISLHVNDYKLLTKKDIDKLLIRIPKISWKFLEEWYASEYEFLIENKDVEFLADGNINFDKSLANLAKKKRNINNNNPKESKVINHGN